MKQKEGQNMCTRAVNGENSTLLYERTLNKKGSGGGGGDFPSSLYVKRSHVLSMQHYDT